MNILYELWDTETRNRVAAFESRAAALAVVRHTVSTQGRSLAEMMVLGTEDDEGEGEVIARGAGLVELAQREVAPRAASGEHFANKPPATNTSGRGNTRYQPNRGEPGQKGR